MSESDLNILLSNFIDFIKTNSNNINNIYINEFDNLKMIYTDKINTNLHHSNELLDYVLHNIDFIIVDKEYNIITYLTKNQIINPVNKKLINDNWSECKVYNNYVGVYCIFFIYEDIKYYCLKYKINRYDDSYISQIIPTVFDNYNDIIHKIIISQRLKHILTYDEEFNLINNKTFDIYQNQLFFSCYDELDYEHNENIKRMESQKKLFNNGYIIIYNNVKYVLSNKLYDKLSGLIPKYTNINKIYLDLYKSDNLNYVINYLSPYPSDIIKRINLSLKTISKEYLNIYHMTRKKAHPEIYEKLDESNKKILYDFHTIFINTRKNEYIIQNEIADKKSLTVDAVYKYIKKLDVDILEKIYLNRNDLIKTVKDVFYNDTNDKFKIFFDDCINTKTISYLLNKNY
jgi:hypothetical protein